MEKKPVWLRKTTWTGVAIIAAAVVPEQYKMMVLTILNGLAIIFMREGIESAKGGSVNAP